MEIYKDIFAEMKIDGYLILDLEEKEIEEELLITKKLHKKKIFNAI